MLSGRGLRYAAAVMLAVLLVLGLAGIGISRAQEGAGRAFLGVGVSQRNEGAFVTEVLSDSPADEAGLREGDLITAVDGDEVTADSPLADLIAAHQPGDEVALTVERGGETINLPATLGEAPEDLPQQPEITMQVGFGGVILEQAAGGWQVTSIEEDSLAEGLLEEGDLITAINGDPVQMTPVSQLAIMAAEGGEMELTVLRGGEETTVTLDVPRGTPLTIIQEGNTTQLFPPQNAQPVQPGQPSIPGMMSTRGFLGVRYEAITPELAEAESLPVEEGALIREVQSDMAAAEAGIEPGDIVTAVDGEPVDEEHTLGDRLYAYEAQDVVTLTVLRGDEEMEFDVTLRAAPVGQSMMPFGPGQMNPGQGPMMPGQGPMMQMLPFEMFSDPDFDWEQFLEGNPDFFPQLQEMFPNFDWESWLEMMPNFPWMSADDPFHQEVEPQPETVPGQQL